MGNKNINTRRVKVTLLGYFFRWLTKNWNELRLFAFHNRTVFEILFILIYTLEQAMLVYWGAKGRLGLSRVSYFALLVLFTFALHKVLMESRMKILEDKVIEMKNENDFIKLESGQMVNDYNEVIVAYERLRENRLNR
jgi:predicted membrane protein|tara:strand:- start:161 stop:574 length:414 start_codon:yes stop_codon:yes gene_type:complete